MDRRFLTVLGVSLVFALVVSSIFYQMTARAGGSGGRSSGDMKDVVVASRPLTIGTTVKPADVKVIKVPGEQFPKGGFGKVEEVIDRPVISAILLDEPVLDGRLAMRGSGLGIAPSIPVGMRAVPVRVNDVVGVAGFVMPGMRVDVLVTGRPGGRGDGVFTNTVLQNILVLAAGQVLQADPRGQTINAPNVTLLVSPDQAEILTLASNEGRIQLVLRNGGDGEIAKTPGRNLEELFGLKAKPEAPPSAAPRPRPRPVQVAAAAPPPPPPPPPPPTTAEVVVIRGNQKAVETVNINRSN